MKTLPQILLLAAVAAPCATGCAHYANVDVVEESCWNGGETVVSSRETEDGMHHVVVERTRKTSGPCDDIWREDLVYDRYGHLQARTLDRLSCGVVEHRWSATLDETSQTWFVEQAIDSDHDDSSDEVIEYELSAFEVDIDGMGLAASCPVMARLPVEVPPSMALAALSK